MLEAGPNCSAIIGRTLLVLLLAPFFLSASHANENCLDDGVLVSVKGVRSDDGLVAALIYDNNPDNFLKNGRKLHRVRQPASSGLTTVCLPMPEPGAYAIAVFHDENANKRLDRGFLGIPSEGYGFSNNPGFRFGVPELQEVLIDLKGGRVEVQVELTYLITE